MTTGDKHHGVPPRFDPASGRTVIEPPGPGYGNWAGAPDCVFDPDTGKYYLYYRLRKPLHEERGGECGIAVSDDGDDFETIWSARKADFGANSIEKGCLIHDPSGRWRLYLSYEVGAAYDRNPPTWRIDLMEADSPEGFDPTLSRPVIDGPMLGFTFVKDPTVLIVGGEYHAYVNVGLPRQHTPAGDDGVIHTRGRGWTALCRSADGVRFSESIVVMSPGGQGWDGFQRRITSVCHLPPAWIAFYDGATHRADSYDEFCGLAVTGDLIHFRSLSLDRPWVESPHASRSIRYLHALPVGDTLHYYYEYCRADRSHELRHNTVPLR